MPKEVYCFACNSAFCKKCIEIKHNGHKFGDLKELAYISRVQIKEKFKPLEEKHEIFSDAREALRVTRTEIKDQGELIKKSIDQSFQELQNILEQHRKKLQEEISTKVQEKLSSLSEQERDLNTALAPLENLITLVEKTLSSDEDVMRTHEEALTKISQEGDRLSTIDEPAAPAAIADLKVDISCAEKIKEVCENHTQIYHTPDPSKCIVEGPALHEVEVGKETHVMVHLNQHDGTPVKNSQTVTGELKLVISESGTPFELIQENETMPIRFTPNVRGRHQISINVNHKAISGSPFPFFVSVPPTELGMPVRIIRGLYEATGVAVNSANEIIVCERGTIAVYESREQKLTEIKQYRYFRDHCLIDVSTDKDDNMYITDSTAHCLIKLPKFGWWTCVGRIGRHQYEFNYPMGVVVVGNEVFVCDMYNNRIQVFNTDKLELTGIINCKNSFPYSITGDDKGNLYINELSEHGTNGITVYNRKGNSMSTLWTRKSFLGMVPFPYTLKKPLGICVYNNDVYVVENSENRVSVFDKHGLHVKSFGRKGNGEGEFDNPTEICADHDGYIYVCDTGNNRIQVF